LPPISEPVIGRAALEGPTANPWRSLRPVAFQHASSVVLTNARNPICAAAAAIRRTHFAVIDYAFLVGGGVASRITVTALSAECLRNSIALGKFSGQSKFRGINGGLPWSSRSRSLWIDVEEVLPWSPLENIGRLF
jgi:hypothetical protein